MISGAPGSGKTTLAGRLGDALHLPVISRDLIKTGLHVTARSEDPAEIHRFAEAAFELFYETVGAMLDGGVSLIAEAAFHADRSIPGIEALAERADLIHLSTRVDPEVSLARYQSRAERGERHPAHDDLGQVERLRATTEVYRLDAPDPLLVIDTTDGYEPGLDAITDFIEQHRSPEP